MKKSESEFGILDFYFLALLYTCFWFEEDYEARNTCRAKLLKVNI